MNLKKCVVVTGGTKGIGKALVWKFAKEGFDIITCSRNETELLALKEEVEKALPIQVAVLPADLSKKADVDQFAAFVKQHASSIEVLINNTGVFLPGEILQEEEGALEKMMDTNLYSAYYLTRHLAPVMVAAKRGHIFSISSIAGITAYASGGSYSITKYAMQGFTKCLRQELKDKNIRVTAVLPGATYTASWEGVDLPEERFMKSEDVASAVYNAYSLSEQTVVEEIILRPQLGDI